LKKLADIFGVSNKVLKSSDVPSAVFRAKKNLGPGVMSNAPDRLDGFHTYNACCRKTSDKGRSTSNLARYSVDRRAFENWAEGDWRGADRLMGLYKSSRAKVPCPVCGKTRKMTPDHIGPISLGFVHRMKFQPMCGSCNSTKNNRLTYGDFLNLVEDEKSGVKVISWHSRFVWERLKPTIRDDKSALEASKVLRKNLHNVLTLLALIAEAGHSAFLYRYLHPEYAASDFEFSDFNPGDGTFSYQKYSVDSLNTQKLAGRYLRISFDSLKTYSTKANRKHKVVFAGKTKLIITSLLADCVEQKHSDAHRKVEVVLSMLASEI
jgi:Alw26I/Eco31I/Esp3I family type II restriction endonuclease